MRKMLFGVIRLKGKANLKKEVRDTFKYLRLYRKNHCTIIPPSKENIGMLRKIERYVTWGEINPETLSLLLQKRAKLPGNKKLTEEYLKDKFGKSFDKLANELLNNELKIKEIPGVKPFFRLKPPRKGFEIKGTKLPYSVGGSFGYRGKDINTLLKRMI